MSNICSHSSKPQQEFLETHQFHVYSIFQFQPCIFVLMLRSCALRIEILASFLGRLLSCERHARIGLFIQLSWFFMHNISISMSTLPFRLDVTVLNWKSWHLGLESSTVVCERHASIWSIHSAFMGSFDITPVLGSLKNPYICWVEHK